MGVLKGALTVRRYRVDGEFPEGFRAAYPEFLQAYAFQDPVSKTSKVETSGWVLMRNLLDTDFQDLDAWLVDNYVVFQMRVDKKTLPAGLFKAHLEKREEAWCDEHGREKAPKNVRDELKDQLEFEWLQRALPRVQTTEVAWNLSDGYVLLHSTSTATNDRFRKLFLQTFSLRLVPENPLDLLGDALADALEATGGTDLRMA